MNVNLCRVAGGYHRTVFAERQLGAGGRCLGRAADGQPSSDGSSGMEGLAVIAAAGGTVSGTSGAIGIGDSPVV